MNRWIPPPPVSKTKFSVFLEKNQLVEYTFKTVGPLCSFARDNQFHHNAKRFEQLQNERFHFVHVCACTTYMYHIRESVHNLSVVLTVCMFTVLHDRREPFHKSNEKKKTFFFLLSSSFLFPNQATIYNMADAATGA